MNVDCHWIEDNLEAAEGVIQSHLQQCSRCHDLSAQLKALDPLIKHVFRQDLAIARAGRPRRSAAMLGGFAVAAAAILIAIILVWPKPPVTSQVSSTTPPANPPAISEVPNVPKVNDGSVERVKPQPATSGQPSSPATPRTLPPKANGEFQVIDIAGYSRTLADYQGHMLIVGVLSEASPQSISSFQRVYESLGRDTELRIIGVMQERDKKPASSTFPVLYNQGSSLFGANIGDYVIVDAAGNVKSSGSLLQNPTKVIAAIRSAL